MTPEKLWGRSGLSGTYEVWSFEEAPDELSELVLQGIKTATCSVYDLYRINNEKIPQEGVSVSSERLCLQSETAIKAVFYGGPSGARTKCLGSRIKRNGGFTHCSTSDPLKNPLKYMDSLVLISLKRWKKSLKAAISLS